MPSNVVGTADGLACVDRTWRWTAELDDDVVLVRGLRDFAGRLLRSGAEHPWNPDISPDALTQTLAAMAGIEWNPALVDAVAAIEAELDVVVNGGDATYEGLSYARNLEGGSSQFAHSSGGARGYREALASSGRMAQALHERDGQVQWLEATLRARDARVGDLDRTLEAVRGSASFRIGRFLTWPVRWPVSLAATASRRLALSMLPPGAPGRSGSCCSACRGSRVRTPLGRSRRTRRTPDVRNVAVRTRSGSGRRPRCDEPHHDRDVEHLAGDLDGRPSRPEHLGTVDAEPAGQRGGHRLRRRSRRPRRRAPRAAAAGTTRPPGRRRGGCARPAPPAYGPRAGVDDDVGRPEEVERADAGDIRCWRRRRR